MRARLWIRLRARVRARLRVDVSFRLHARGQTWVMSSNKTYGFD